MVGFLWITILFSLSLILVCWLCLGEWVRVFKLKNHTNRGGFFVDSFSGASLVCKRMWHVCLCGFLWVYPQSTNTLTRRRNRFTYKEARDYSTRVGLWIVTKPGRLDKRPLFDQLWHHPISLIGTMCTRVPGAHTPSGFFGKNQTTHRVRNNRAMLCHQL